MSKYTVTQLVVYPIKSLAGISLQKTQISNAGLIYDRFWMLVDETGLAVTQRDYPSMALFRVEFQDQGVIVHYKEDSLEIPFKNDDLSTVINTQMWENDIIAYKESDLRSQWFSKKLGKTVFLVRPSESAPRFQNQNPDALVHFPDSSPYLLLGESAMEHLNSKLNGPPLLINRFRANIIFSGGEPHIEDTWKQFSIGSASFQVIKPCARCQMTTINQEDASMTKEPLRTMSTYRKDENAVFFGQYLKLLSGLGTTISIGQTIDL